MYQYMDLAIEEAKKCIEDVPIGCVIVHNNNVIASAHNMRENNIDVTAHAEILAIQQAQRFLKTSHLSACEMYVTLEPCPMCSWAIIQSGISTVYYGASNDNYGSLGSNPELSLIQIANSKIKVYSGIKEDVCKDLLKNFFKGIR